MRNWIWHFLIIRGLYYYSQRVIFNFLYGIGLSRRRDFSQYTLVVCYLRLAATGGLLLVGIKPTQVFWWEPAKVMFFIRYIKKGYTLPLFNPIGRKISLICVISVGFSPRSRKIIYVVGHVTCHTWKLENLWKKLNHFRVTHGSMPKGMPLYILQFFKICNCDNSLAQYRGKMCKFWCSL